MLISINTIYKNVNRYMLFTCPNLSLPTLIRIYDGTNKFYQDHLQYSLLHSCNILAKRTRTKLITYDIPNFTPFPHNNCTSSVNTKVMKVQYTWVSLGHTKTIALEFAMCGQSTVVWQRCLSLCTIHQNHKPVRTSMCTVINTATQLP